VKTTTGDRSSGNSAQQQENEVKTAIAAMLLATAIAGPSNAQEVISEAEMWQRVWPSVRTYMANRSEAKNPTSRYESQTVMNSPFGRTTMRTQAVIRHPAQ
jgi:hypothetical protein